MCQALHSEYTVALSASSESLRLILLLQVRDDQTRVGISDESWAEVGCALLSPPATYMPHGCYPVWQENDYVPVTLCKRRSLPYSSHGWESVLCKPTFSCIWRAGEVEDSRNLQCVSGTLNPPPGASRWASNVVSTCVCPLHTDIHIHLAMPQLLTITI